MEEGVECMVELANANKEVVVLIKSIDTTAIKNISVSDNCAAVFIH